MYFMENIRKNILGGIILENEKKNEDTVIDKIYFNFISTDHRDGKNWMKAQKGYDDMMYSLLGKHPEIPWVRLHTGETFYVDNLKFDVLCSHEDVFPEDNSNYNDSSVVLMMTAENSKVLFPGDAGHEESYILERRYPEYLKSDIVQQAHHGHFGTTENFYRLVDARIALFPVTQIKFDEELHNYKANEVSIEIADEYYIASNGTVEIDLPYKSGEFKLHPDETFENFQGINNLWNYEYTDERKAQLYKEYLERGGKKIEEYDYKDFTSSVERTQAQLLSIRSVVADIYFHLDDKRSNICDFCHKINPQQLRKARQMLRKARF